MAAGRSPTQIMIYICGEYNAESKSLSGLRITMPVEVELRENYMSGRSIEVGSKAYVLGDRTLYRKESIVAYKLIPTRGEHG